MEKIYKGEIQRLLPIFQAMADGKTIQTKNGIGWIDIDGDEDGLNLDSIINYQDCYRIKPEPKFRPFKNAEECWNEMQKHQPFGWIKNGGYWYNIITTGVMSVKIIDTRGAIATLYFSDLLAHYRFADGTLFGVKTEEG